MKYLCFTLSLLLATIFSGCQEAPKEQPAVSGPKGATVTPVSATITNASLYNLDTDWITQEGKDINLSAYKGKPVLVSMIYTSCAFACPRTVADLQRIEKGLKGYQPEDFKILLVTIDPARDTTARLQAFATENNLDLRRWNLLTNQPEEIQELAALLNVKFRKALNGEFAHSNLITLLNAEGEIVHQQQGLGASPAETIQKMQELLGPQ